MQRKFSKGDGVYFISDLHLYHNNIIKYCNRPFSTIDEMNITLIENWNKVITNKDHIFILGDFCFSNLQTIESILKQLNGIKYFINGNHDNWKAFKKLAGYFEFMGEVLDIQYEKRHFVLCHYPFLTWNRSFHGSINLHGHIHEMQTNRKNQYNVGVDLNNYLPIHIDDILINIEIINSKLEETKNVDINYS